MKTNWVFVLVTSLLFIILSCEDVVGPVVYENPSHPDSIIAIIVLGDDPYGVVALPQGNSVYVSNKGSEDVHVIRTSDFSVVDTIPMQGQSRDIISTPDGEYVYVALYDNATVEVIRTSDNSVITSIPVGKNPGNMQVTPDGEHIYVFNRTGFSVSVIRTSDNTVEKTIELGYYAPSCSGILPNGDYVYAGNMSSEYLIAIRTSDNFLIDSIYIGDKPSTILSTTDGNYLQITNCSSNDPRYYIMRVSDNTIVQNIRTIRSYTDAIRLPGTWVAYMIRKNDNRVSVLNMENQVFAPSIGVGTDPVGLAASADGRYIYVANNITDDLYVIGYSSEDSE